MYLSLRLKSILDISVSFLLEYKDRVFQRHDFLDDPKRGCRLMLYAKFFPIQFHNGMSSIIMTPAHSTGRFRTYVQSYVCYSELGIVDLHTFFAVKVSKIFGRANLFSNFGCMQLVKWVQNWVRKWLSEAPTSPPQNFRHLHAKKSAQAHNSQLWCV